MAKYVAVNIISKNGNQVTQTYWVDPLQIVGYYVEAGVTVVDLSSGVWVSTLEPIQSFLARIQEILDPTAPAPNPNP